MADIPNILLFEDDEDDVLIIRDLLERNGIESELRVVETPAEFLAALDSSFFNLILSDSTIPGFSGVAAFEAARSKRPEVPFIAYSGLAPEDEQAKRLMKMGVSFVSKQKPGDLAPMIQKLLSGGLQRPSGAKFVPYTEALDRLVEAVQRLSLARNLDAIMEIVRHAARELTGADGASFVLREGNLCHYAEEYAIAPLWKGQRFPMSACISGWAMLNRQAAVIPDIYADERIPADAYRPTFVKSLVMVPIRTADPIGAIGSYWAERCAPPAEVVRVLQALADTTSVAMENMQLYQDLELRVKERTAELVRSNDELKIANTRLQVANEDLAFLNNEMESFASAVSHDLRAPIRKISMFVEMLEKRISAGLDEKSMDYIKRTRSSSARMGEMIEDLLSLSRAVRATAKREIVDMSGLARQVASDLQSDDQGRNVEFAIADGISANGDPGLLRTVLENLLGNAYKFSSKRAASRIELGTMQDRDGLTVYFVRDNGAGFDMKHAEKLFAPFQRLHESGDFPGTGVGLATVQRIIHKHRGRIWAEAEQGAGATFYFTLGQSL